MILQNDYTPLHGAAMKGNINTASVLVAQKANIDAKCGTVCGYIIRYNVIVCLKNRQTEF